MSAGLLEHDGHNVVPNVSLPQQLAVRETRLSSAGAGRLLMWDVTQITQKQGQQLVRLSAEAAWGPAFHPHLLFVVGRVRQQRRHVEHELVVLESCVQGVGSSGVGCGEKKVIQLASSV